MVSTVLSARKLHNGQQNIQSFGNTFEPLSANLRSFSVTLTFFLTIYNCFPLSCLQPFVTTHNLLVFQSWQTSLPFPRKRRCRNCIQSEDRSLVLCPFFFILFRSFHFCMVHLFFFLFLSCIAMSSKNLNLKFTNIILIKL